MSETDTRAYLDGVLVVEDQKGDIIRKLPFESAGSTIELDIPPLTMVGTVRLELDELVVDHD